MAALGIYCDLMSLPGMLSSQHQHYAGELRPLGTRSVALIQNLIEHLQSSFTQGETVGQRLDAASKSAYAARDLMGQLGIYCDLLSMPGVLKPEERCSADELRVLCTRGLALIEHLMQLLLEQSTPPSLTFSDGGELGAYSSASSTGSGAGPATEEPC
jgi:hypothetical protein